MEQLTAVRERIMEECTNITGLQMRPPDCLHLLNSIGNISGGVLQRCDLAIKRILRWIVPPLMVLCASGNILALLIYKLSYFHGSSSVHFLRVKALANLIFVTSRPLEVIHAWTYPASPIIEPLYWHTRTYIMTISNICGTMSTWLTLLVTIETVMCVTLPFTFRQYCTEKMTWTLLSIALFFSTCLNVAGVPGMDVWPIVTARLWKGSKTPCWYFVYSYIIMASSEHAVLHSSIYWTQMFSVVFIPTIAMLVCSFIIIKQFSLRQLGDNFSQRRKCVIRMTVSTALSHLLLEGPALLTYSAVAFWGQRVQGNYSICVLNHMINLGSVINATIPCFLFILCSDQFRHMARVFLKANLEKNKDRRADILAQAGMRRSCRSRGIERSTADAHLIQCSKL